MNPLDNCGYCGKDVIWVIDDTGTLTISGTGNMDDYSTSNAAPWQSIASDITKVIIEKGVTGIGNYAFSDCVNLTSISINETVEKIGAYAFNNCTQLKEITVTENISFIGDYAFSGCVNLAQITFKGTAPTINTNSFSKVTAIAYFPGNDISWTADTKQNYGGSITWESVYEGGKNPDWIIDPIAGIVTGIPEKIPAESVVENFQNGNTEVSITASDGSAVTYAGTGNLLNIDNASYTIVILGDLTGDGKIAMQDLVTMQRTMLKLQELKGAYLLAATPVSGNANSPQMSDLVRLRRYLLGLSTNMHE